MLIRDTDWLVVTIRGLRSEEDARQLGIRLQRSSSIAASFQRIGIDVGENVATSNFADSIKDTIFKDFGLKMLDDVHGVTVYPNTPHTVITASGGIVTAFTKASGTLTHIEALLSQVEIADAPEYQAVLLMNAAMMNIDALARMVLAISAVELLATGSGWTEAQTLSIGRLIDVAEQDCEVPPSELTDLIKVLSRLQKQKSITTGIKLLLTTLGLESLKPRWDKLYGQRSAVFHANKYMSASQRTVGADDVLSICGRIVLAALQAKHPSVQIGYEAQYPLSA
ncbi:hypothetical protein KX816_06415 [Sphingosinicellaceae bacterium]|nr:hypothetical protein KX816_06415 [Sphingosinicellaceae bacterium]